MDDEVKSRFDDLDKRLASTDKRIDDIKSFIGGTSGLVAFIFGSLTFIANSNLNTEKTAIREDMRDFKAQFLGQQQPAPQLELFKADGVPLQNQTVPATFQTDDKGGLQLVVPIILKNTGDALTGPMYVKFYTKAPLHFDSRSTDETRSYDTEDVLQPETLHPSEIPGKISFEANVELDLASGQNRPPAGSYPVLVKVFYGKGKVAQAEFRVLIS